MASASAPGPGPGPRAPPASAPGARGRGRALGALGLVALLAGGEGAAAGAVGPGVCPVRAPDLGDLEAGRARWAPGPVEATGELIVRFRAYRPRAVHGGGVAGALGPVGAGGGGW